MANEENLKPFKKGQSGNPKGRPPLPNLKKVMAEHLGEQKEGKTPVDALILKLRHMALNGNLKAAEMLLAYAYGKPQQNIKQETSTEPIQIEIVRSKPEPKADEGTGDE